jgi:AbrB family looped-hinge helix DNA binding protein
MAKAAFRLSRKGQVTIPKVVRETLQLNPGDLVAYHVSGGVVTLRRLEPFDESFHAAQDLHAGQPAIIAADRGPCGG